MLLLLLLLYVGVGNLCAILLTRIEIYRCHICKQSAFSMPCVLIILPRILFFSPLDTVRIHNKPVQHHITSMEEVSFTRGTLPAASKSVANNQHAAPPSAGDRRWMFFHWYCPTENNDPSDAFLRPAWPDTPLCINYRPHDVGSRKEEDERGLTARQPQTLQ